ncbi:hypothetical protein J2S40_004154 [Nocardioides luteus]|uniref:hypothetical protein n=1 Tax=Nocardioides luteus TaxID=1844 RepID=UPI00166C6465|nr:hypothetical protein [Nocardioides luteus]MDR7313096.1 hypothetical protein [Nocardioides luteus]
MRVLKALCVAVLALVGLAVMASSLTQSGGDRMGMALFGFAVLVVAAGSAVVWFPRSRRPEAYVSAVEGAVTLSLTRRLQVVTLTMLVVLGVLLLVGAVAVGGPSGWILGVLALVLLLPVPDLLTGVARRPCLQIDAHRVAMRGAAQDVQIAWADVLDVSQADLNAQTPVVRVRGRDGAASYEHTKRGILFGRRPAGPDLDVPSTSLDDPYGIYVILNGLAMARDEERPGMVAAIPELLRDRADGIRPENEPRR